MTSGAGVGGSLGAEVPKRSVLFINPSSSIQPSRESGIDFNQQTTVNLLASLGR